MWYSLPALLLLGLLLALAGMNLPVAVAASDGNHQEVHMAEENTQGARDRDARDVAGKSFHQQHLKRTGTASAGKAKVNGAVGPDGKPIKLPDQDL